MIFLVICNWSVQSSCWRGWGAGGRWDIAATLWSSPESNSLFQCQMLAVTSNVSFCVPCPFVYKAVLVKTTPFRVKRSWFLMRAPKAIKASCSIHRFALKITVYKKSYIRQYILSIKVCIYFFRNHLSSLLPLLSFRSCLLSQPLTTARNISLKQPSTGDKL